MNFWKSLTGMLDVELTSAEQENTLTTINTAGIELFRMQKLSELTCRFRICRGDYGKLKKLCEKRGETLRVLRRRGLYWTSKTLISRPIIITGILLFASIVIFLPSRVLFVQVDGNINVPAKQILEAAEECGICFGASRRQVRSEKVKNALLSEVPELQWAGVNTSGCVATISVRERTDTETVSEENVVTNIVAARDGYILSGTVTQGNAVFQVGQTVKEGQVLISGYTDCGICIRATRSEGEIVAQTIRKMEAITPSSYVARDELQDRKRKISLLYRKKRINLWKDSGISDATCGRMYEEYYITLPGGFQLPIALCVETYTFYTTHTAGISQTDAEAGLNNFSDNYLIQQMVAGMIQEKSEMTTLENGIYRLTGEYICTEMIGREQREQIGDTNGKSG